MLCPKYVLERDVVYSEVFRGMDFEIGDINKLEEFARKNNMSTGEIIALYICENYDLLSEKKSDTSGDESKIKSIYEYSGIDLRFCRYTYGKKQKQAFIALKNACDSVFLDLQCFPVAQNSKAPASEYTVSYVDTWLGERDFGGNRRHEGTDIMADVNERGVYPIVSVTKGVVEKIGWLKLGGYRIGIRAENGGYFYYAHLDSYSNDYNVGDTVEAGEIIGFMGDSGYGPVGTVGKFGVHLHFGIYIKDSDGNELSINPYNVLKSLENSKKQISFY